MKQSKARLTLLFITGCFASLTACNRRVVSEWVFESQARPVVSVRSSAPELIVLPSGAVLATLVEPYRSGADDLFFYTSAAAGDAFVQTLKLNAGVGAVHPHHEGTPRLMTGGPGCYYALWTGDARKGMSLYFSRSDDYGHSFSHPIPLDAQTGGSHPFFNAGAARSGTLIVVWIAYDAVKGAVPGTGVLQIVRATDGGQSFSAPKRLAIDVCPCCRPELKTDGRGNWYLAWRHVDPDQARDIVVASSHDNGATWSNATRVSRDGWHIDGCPDSGPSLALFDGKVFVAWHTVINDQQRLFWSSSEDHGGHFDQRHDLSGLVRDPNHPYLARIGGHLLVAFQGRDPKQNHGWGNQRIYLQELAPVSSPKPIALAHGTGSASYPIAVALGPDEVMAAWTESSETGDRSWSIRGHLQQRP